MGTTRTTSAIARALGGAALLLRVAVASPGEAQEVRSLPLSAAQYDVEVLTPAAPARSSDFQVEDAAGISILITATSPGLVTSIDAPGGMRIDADTAASAGGSFTSVRGPAAPGAAFPLPQLLPGEHFEYTLPSFGAGVYRVHFEAPAGLSEEAVVMTRVLTDSPCRAALFAVEEEVALGDAAVLTAAVFDGAMPVGDAEVEVTVAAEEGAPVILALRDDGEGADDAAGDGLYSGSYTPPAPGPYRASARISGRTGSGAAFVRQTATQFAVVAVPARPTGAVSDAGVDQNFNGLFDLLRLEVGVELERALDVNVYAHLGSTGGDGVVRSTTASLAAGTHAVAVDFEADAVRSLGEDGPWRIDRVEVVPLGDAEAPAGARDLGGQTQAYLLSQFDGSPYVFTGAVVDEPLDDDGDGRIDRLRVSFEVIPSGQAGLYAWTLLLADAGGNPIELGSGSAVLISRRVFLEVIFTGEAIAAGGASGPYRLLDLVLEGPRGFLRVADLGSTGAYVAEQFARTCAGDCSGDGAVALDDLRLLVAHGLRGSVPDDCASADLALDAQITVEEIVHAVTVGREGCP